MLKAAAPLSSPASCWVTFDVSHLPFPDIWCRQSFTKLSCIFIMLSSSAQNCDFQKLHGHSPPAVVLAAKKAPYLSRLRPAAMSVQAKIFQTCHHNVLVCTEQGQELSAEVQGRQGRSGRPPPQRCQPPGTSSSRPPMVGVSCCSPTRTQTDLPPQQLPSALCPASGAPVPCRHHMLKQPDHYMRLDLL